MRLWLDDDPHRKVPPGYDTVVRTAPEAIQLIGSGKYHHISLDHDLGDPQDPSIGTGYDVAIWVEEQAYYGKLPRLTWDIHSANPVGRQRMLQALTNADRYWTMQEQKFSKASAVRIAVVAPSDKKVVDAFYKREKAEGNRLSTDGRKLVSLGMGGGDIAEWRGPKVVITTPMDSQWVQSVVRYIEKSFPSNLVSRTAAVKFTLDEAKTIAAELGIDFEKGGFDADQFMRGLNVELEHGTKIKRTDVSGNDPLITGKIAWAHLIEFPDYYDRLDRMESEAKKDMQDKAAAALPLLISVRGHVYRRVAVSGRELNPKQLADSIEMFLNKAQSQLQTELAGVLAGLKEYVKGKDESAFSKDEIEKISALEKRSNVLDQDIWTVLDEIKSFSAGKPIKLESKPDEDEDEE